MSMIRLSAVLLFFTCVVLIIGCAPTSEVMAFSVKGMD